MVEIIFDVEERASKGIVHEYEAGFSNTSKKYQEPPSIYQTLMDMTEIDPTLFSACSLTADLVTLNGYDFIGENKGMIKEAKKRFNNELDFDKVMKNIVWQLIVYGDAYMEVKWNESKTKVMELTARDTMDMVINYDKHGEIENYVEKVEGKSEKDWITYTPLEIIPFHLYQIGSQIYSRNPFKAIARDFSTGIAARDYVHGIFTNLSPRTIYFLKNANDKQRKDFIQNLIIAKRKPEMDIIAQGEEFDAKVSSLEFTGLIDILNWNQKRILKITRVPPHWDGMLDGANRGIGENIMIPFESKIKTIQHELASQTNKELMPKLNYSNLDFKWNAISLMNQKEIIGNAGQLDAIGLDSETILDYLRNHGINLRQGAKIEKLEDEGKMRGGTQIQKDAAPSRQRKGAGDKMGNKLNSKGVSPESKVKSDKKKVSV